jgi:hypothetical protein
VFKTKLEWRGRDGLNDEKLHILFKRRNAHKKVICRAKTSEKVSFFGSSLSLVLVAGMTLYATKTKLSDCRIKTFSKNTNLLQTFKKNNIFNLSDWFNKFFWFFKNYFNKFF